METITIVTIIAILITVATGYIVFFYLLLRKKKGIPNPEIKDFEAYIEDRGLILGEARGYNIGIIIDNPKDFINFATRNKVGTIFKSFATVRSNYYKTIRYFYIYQGKIISTRINKTVKSSEAKKWT